MITGDAPARTAIPCDCSSSRPVRLSAASVLRLRRRQRMANRKQPAQRRSQIHCQRPVIRRPPLVTWQRFQRTPLPKSISVRRSIRERFGRNVHPRDDMACRHVPSIR